MNKEIELIIRKSALKDVELWLNMQYVEIEKELIDLKSANTIKSDNDNDVRWSKPIYYDTGTNPTTLKGSSSTVVNQKPAKAKQ